MFEFPNFGPDISRVSGFIELGHDVYARLFLPLERTGTGHYVPWRVAAKRFGLVFDAYTTWDNLSLAVAAETGIGWELPRGTADDKTVHALVEAIATESVMGAATPTSFALWEGYAGDIDETLRESSIPIPATGANFLCDWSYRLLTARLDWTLTRTNEHRRRFPTAVWPADRSFVLASPPYQDSIYVSCSRAMFGAACAAGLDLLEIDPDAPLPSRGD